MTIHVNKELTRKVAHLAKLALSEGELEDFTGQLDKILSYVQLIEEVDVSGTEPLLHPHEWTTPLRTDEPKTEAEGLEQAEGVRSSAQDLVHDGFRVPSTF